MKEYLKPIVNIYEIEPVKLFACSEGIDEDETIDIRYNKSNDIWKYMDAD